MDNVSLKFTDKLFPLQIVLLLFSCKAVCLPGKSNLRKKMIGLNKEELKKILPHREPMLLIDEAGILDDGSAEGRYTVRGDEWFLKGHFPGNPTVPGVILCEMMGQACCVMIAEKLKGKTPYFTGIEKVKFHHPVKPGDILNISCRISRGFKDFYFTKCKGIVNGKTVVVGDLSFAVVG